MKEIKTLPVKPIDVLISLTNYSKKYIKDAKSSIIRNNHMNELNDNNNITQEQIEATIVDFINYIGATCGIDYALYTSDLKESIQKIYSE